MQVTLTGVYREQKTSQRTGKPFTSLRIQTQEHGDKWLSGFGNQDNANWDKGQTVEIEVEQKGEYLNFNTPKIVKQNFAGDEVLKTKIGKIASDVEHLTELVDEIHGILTANKINVDDIPL